MGKLYPPNIAGILPSFYENEKGTAFITVPFSMNKIVKKDEISCFSLRIKSANTDILYGEIKSEPHAWVSSNVVDSEVFFEVTNLLPKFTVGSYYKIQLAYVDTNNIIGYYSTVAIVKFTTKPTVAIGNFDDTITNGNSMEYIGTYDNIQDPSERVYQYKFTLYNKNNQILETSGWLIHNSYEDTSLSSSIDKYTLRYALEQDVTYKMEYTVLTNNNLEISSPKYLIMESQTVDSELTANLVASLNYENAYISLALIPKDLQQKEEPITGRFILSRSSSKDNFSTWLQISEFKLIGQYCSAFSFKDYSIEQGIEYQYSLQQTNDYYIRSNRILTNIVKANFEHIYLFDGTKQLKIQFNPKISSFKTVVLENKKTTIGNKYPFIFRNGSVAYKEFPINGLISLLINNDNFSNIEYINTKGEEKTDITDNNMTSERLFKLEVLNWLNNGEIKLFKSPQEGNYIVRLMNVSLTPVDQVSRMLHNFSCQATEVAEYNFDNLVKYKLVNTEGATIYQTRWESIDLQQTQIKMRQQGSAIYGMNLLEGHSTKHIKIVDAIMGMTFNYEYDNGEKEELMIGATGAYEVFVDRPIIKMSLSLKTNAIFNNGASPNLITDSNTTLIKGIFTYSYESLALNKFNKIENISTLDIPCEQFFGPNNNILNFYQNIRRNISRIYYMHFQKMPIQEINSSQFALNQSLNGKIVSLISSDEYMPKAIYEIQKIDEKGNILRKYYRYYNGVLYEFPHHFNPYYEQNNQHIVILNEYTTYQDPNTKYYYRLQYDYLVQINTDVNLRHIDLDPYSIYLKRYYNSNNQLMEDYYYYDGIQLNLINKNDLKNLYSVKINWGIHQKYGSGDLSLQDRDEIYFNEIHNVPESIQIGPGVCIDIGLQVKNISYQVEEYCDPQIVTNYQNALKTYLMYQLNFILVQGEERKNLVNNAKDPEISKIYYIWDKEKFKKITSESELLAYENNINVEIYSHLTANQSHAISPSLFASCYDNMVKAEEDFMEEIDKNLSKQAEGLM